MERRMRQIADLAEQTRYEMDGTAAEIERRIAESDLAFAIWRDETEEHGIGYIALKGGSILGETLVASEAHPAKIACILCRDSAEAIALELRFGAPPVLN